MDSCVDWQNAHPDIKSRGKYILDTEKWADCKFLVGTEPNQQMISGHKLILAMASPVFERMFYGNLPDKDEAIQIPDVQPDAFRAMMEYIYSDSINITSFDKACELCYVAKKYILPHVVERCTQFLWSDLSPKNACRAYEFARLFEEPRLMQKCIQIISTQTRDVLADPSFLDIEMNTLLVIFDQNVLNIESELDLFNALNKIAHERGYLTSKTQSQEQLQQDVSMEAQVNENGGEKSNSNQSDAKDEDQENCLKDENKDESNKSDVFQLDNDSPIRNAVKKIRFLTLTPQQFAEGPARSNLLTQSEALSILINISSPAINDCPLPEGFCSNRQSRTSPKSNFGGISLIFNATADLELPSIREYDYNIPYDSSAYNVGASSSSSLPPNYSRYLEHLNECNYAHKIARKDGPRNSPDTGREPRSGDYEHNAFRGMRDDFRNSPDQNLTSNNQLVNVNHQNNDYGHETIQTRKFYCVRTIRQQMDYRNTSVTDCSLTFSVDKNILITGVQVPTQVLCGELMNSAGFTERYSEILYAHLLDSSSYRLTYTHYTSRVRYDSLLEISFDRPVFIRREEIYKIGVVFNKVGWYPIYTCSPEVTCDGVRFTFNMRSPDDALRDGLIRAIVFTHPPP